MRPTPLPPSLLEGSFSLRAADKAAVPRKRTRARDVFTVSRGIRMPLGGQPKGAAAVRAYTDLDASSLLSHHSAARLLGIALPSWAQEDWRIHVARPATGSTPRRVNVVGHRMSLAPDEVATVDGVRVTSVARTWLDLASRLSLDELIAAGDSIVCSHGPEFPVRKEPLAELESLQRMVARHRRARGILNAREALGLIRVGVDSPPETQMRLALVRAGLPEPELNVVLRDGSGMPAVWPDACYPGYRISIQYDGGHHGTAEQYGCDIRRADSTAQLRWLEVRVDKTDLRGERPAVVAKVLRALKSRGRRAGPDGVPCLVFRTQECFHGLSGCPAVRDA